MTIRNKTISAAEILLSQIEPLVLEMTSRSIGRDIPDYIPHADGLMTRQLNRIAELLFVPQLDI